PGGAASTDGAAAPHLAATRYRRPPRGRWPRALPHQPQSKRFAPCASVWTGLAAPHRKELLRERYAHRRSPGVVVADPCADNDVTVRAGGRSRRMERETTPAP